jgi:ATP adenylyltransferase
MEASAALDSSVGRFAGLLANGTATRPIYDKVLLEKHGCLVAPTLGSIVPNWLLIVPRTPSINFAQLKDRTGAEPSHLIRNVLAEYGVAGDRAIWFEHGASSAGSLVGCGVDQAHLHVLVDAPFSFQDFEREAKRASDLGWERRVAQTAYDSLEADTSYLLAAQSDWAVVATKVESVGSQFFRRVVANLIHQPEIWNYRSHPNLRNVHETIRNFSRRFAKTAS